MDRDLLFVIVRAAMEAAVKIAKVTPTLTDDRVLVLAQAILDAVQGAFGNDDKILSTEEHDACAAAADQIRSALDRY